MIIPVCLPSERETLEWFGGSWEGGGKLRRQRTLLVPYRKKLISSAWIVARNRSKVEGVASNVYDVQQAIENGVGRNRGWRWGQMEMGTDGDE